MHPTILLNYARVDKMDRKEKFKLLKFLNKGGCASIYLAEVIDPVLLLELPMIVVLKIASNFSMEKLLIKEVINRMALRPYLQSKQGANLVHCYGFEVFQGDFVLVFEYLNGHTLKSIVENKGTLCTRYAVSIAREVSKSIGWLHTHNFCHGDINPSNIMICSDGEIKIIDFGISGFMDALQFTNNLEGTLAYMAPEIITGHRKTFASDVYSAGATLYEMVTGRRLYHGNTIMEILNNMTQCAVIPPKDINSEIDDKLNLIILKAINQNSEVRYSNGIDLFDALNQYLSDLHKNNRMMKQSSDEIGSDSLTNCSAFDSLIRNGTDNIYQNHINSYFKSRLYQSSTCKEKLQLEVIDNCLTNIINDIIQLRQKIYDVQNQIDTERYERIEKLFRELIYSIGESNKTETLLLLKKIELMLTDYNLTTDKQREILSATSQSVGISFGTFNCVMAIKKRNTEIISNNRGESTTRAAVSFYRGLFIIGTPAIDTMASAYKDTIIFIKRLIGRTFNDPEVQNYRQRCSCEIKIAPENSNGEDLRVIIGGKEYSPIEISAMILNEMKTGAEDKSRLGKHIDQAVITVPAYCLEKQKNAMRKAGHLAGFKVLTILDEPTAAVIASSLDNVGPDEVRTILVYDLGGGAFDVSLLAVTGGACSILEAKGYIMLGGEIFDNKIVDYVVDQVKLRVGINAKFNRGFMVALIKEAERAKIALSNMNHTDIIVTGLLKDTSDNLIDVIVPLSRRQFETMIQPEIIGTIEIVQTIIKSANISKEMIDYVLLVGGCSQIPLVQRTLADTFGDEKLLKITDPIACFAQGAAIHAIRVRHESVPQLDAAEKSDENKHIDSDLNYSANIVSPNLDANKNQKVVTECGITPIRVYDITTSINDTDKVNSMVDSQPNIIQEAPALCMDLVHFSVTSVASMAPSKSYIICIWAYLEQKRAAMMAQAREEINNKAMLVHSRGPFKIAQGTIITVRLKISGMTTIPKKQTILWEGETGNAQFVIQIPKNTRKGSYQGTVTIYTDNISESCIYFEITVGKEENEVKLLSTKEYKYHKAFASYASEDRDEVFARLQMLKKIRPDMEVFIDVISIRSGEDWKQKITNEILISDVFYLFWSAAAKESPWVNWEWRSAFKQRGLDFIDPVPLVSFKKVPPPDELKDIHFDDALLAHMKHGLNG